MTKRLDPKVKAKRAQERASTRAAVEVLASALNKTFDEQKQDAEQMIARAALVVAATGLPAYGAFDLVVRLWNRAVGIDFFAAKAGLASAAELFKRVEAEAKALEPKTPRVVGAIPPPSSSPVLELKIDVEQGSFIVGSLFDAIRICGSHASELDEFTIENLGDLGRMLCEAIALGDGTEGSQ